MTGHLVDVGAGKLRGLPVYTIITIIITIIDAIIIIIIIIILLCHY